MKSIVVTGASTGIGRDAARILIENGFRVYGSVRKQEDADGLVKDFGENFIPLFFDVTDEAAVHAATKQVREELNGETLFGLVNNAGVAVAGPMMHLPIESFRKQLEINVTGQLIVTQAFIPLLGSDRSLKGKPGRVINISSASGKNGSPFVGAYAASKHALEGMSESMRRELMLYGIDVIIIGPGPIATPIWDKAEQEDPEQYKNTDYYESGTKFQKYALKSGRNGLPVERVSEVVFQALTSAKPRVRYTITPNPFRSWIMSILSKRYIDNLIAKNLGFIK
ncbi:MAG TPA: SDR family oxidoreductase [Anaerolineales bacterium]|nr:SDR family oxidoreductase [Anaerolineales bacterium]